MSGQDALWSAQEVRTQAAQARGQMTVWECIGELCAACNAEPGEECRPGCIGLAALQDAL